MKELSIFAMQGPELLYEGMLPQKILKVRYLKLAKIDFPTLKNGTKFTNFHITFVSKNQDF